MAKRNAIWPHFQIFAETPEACEQARGLLEFIIGSVTVPRSLAGKIIGRNGDKIQVGIHFFVVVIMGIGLCISFVQKFYVLL